jgi:hypothetical protein
LTGRKSILRAQRRIKAQTLRSDYRLANILAVPLGSLMLVQWMLAAFTPLEVLDYVLRHTRRWMRPVDIDP